MVKGRSKAGHDGARLRALVRCFESMELPTALVGPDLEVQGANPAFRRLMPARRAKAAIAKGLAACLEAMGGEAVQPEDGALVRPAATPGRVFRLALSKAKGGAVVTLIDVTPERKALEDLRYGYELRDQLMHDAKVGTWRYDPDADAYEFSSHLSLGHEQSNEPVPRQVLQLIQHRGDAVHDDAIRVRLTTEGGQAEGNIRYRAAEGGWTHLHVHYRSGRQTPSGRYEMYGLSQNVTEVAEARDEAANAAQRLKLALGAARAGVFEYDFKKQRYWLSPELRAMIGEKALAAIGGDARKLFHKGDRKVFARRDDGGQPLAADIRLRRGGRYRWVRLYFEVERDEKGASRRGVGLLLDIDEAKRQSLALDVARRAAESATEAKSRFLASVSHEIRTPMNGIVGVLNLLKREQLTEEGRDLLAEALACSEMLGQLINDVLDFSKIEAGKLELAPIPTDPVEVARSVINLLAPQAHAKGLYLRSRFEAEPGHVSVDPVRLRQCLFNIVGNAVKFTEKGGVEVRFLALEGDKLRFEVEDTGVGVPDHARASLFGRFQQADSSASRKFGGTGLGLAISRQLARQMGGDIDFTSREGQGSTFWFEFEAAPVEAEHAAAAEADLSAMPLTGLSILVVDDNATNRLVAVKTLQAMGADAESVDGGQACLDALAERAYDLILMDINMPGMDGMEATRRIRALPGPIAGLPIVALTADVMTHQRQAYLDAGMDGVAPKPFSPVQLLTVIMELSAGEQDAHAA